LFFPKFDFNDRDNCVFIDEIQKCSDAITSLKFLILDNKIDIICSGSLLGVETMNDIDSYPVGFTKNLTMLPLDFEEYL
jgi:predicted AAA+ superfamily ATPase